MAPEGENHPQPMLGYSVFTLDAPPAEPVCAPLRPARAQRQQAPDIAGQAEAALTALSDWIHDQLLQHPHTLPSFPAGPMLPLPADATPLALDPTMDNAAARATVFFAMLGHLGLERPNPLAPDHERFVHSGALTGLVRHAASDWISWLPEPPPLECDAAALARQLPAAALRALERLAGDGQPGNRIDTHTEHLLEGLIDNLDDHFNYDRRLAAAAGHDAEPAALRPDCNAFARPVLPAPRPEISAAAQDATNKALAEPFGGRTLLAAFYLRQVLSHMATHVPGQGCPSPANLLVCDRALRVANHVAALPGHPLAAAAATVAAALRLLNLGPAKPGADVLQALPTALRSALPVCFQRKQLQDPEAMAAMACELFERAPNGAGLPFGPLVAPVSALARRAASLLFDPPQAAVMGLAQAQFRDLAARAEGLKKGGECARLQQAAPDACHRVHRLLPQLERAFRCHGWMADKGAAAFSAARQQLHQQRHWPLPTTTDTRQPARRGSSRPT